MEPQTTERAARRLTRSRSDRVIAGVCGGAGEYFGIDPVIVRIGFVVLALLGGSGLVLYGVAWLAVPEEGHRRPIAHGVVRRGASPSTLGIVLLAIGGLLVLHELVHVSTVVTSVLLILAGGALLVWSPGNGNGDPAPPPPAPPPPTEPTAVIPPPPAPAPRRQRSYLGRLTLSAILLLAGAAGLADAADTLDVTVEGFLAVALLVTGLGLVVGAWWGRARSLIVLGILLSIALGVAGSFDVPFEGGFGERRIHPDHPGELEDVYRLAAGEMKLDLSDLDLPDGVTEVEATVAFGHLDVTVPPDITVVVEASAEMGQLTVFGENDGGMDVEQSAVSEEPGAPELHLELAVGGGRIDVVRPASGGD